MPFCTKCGAEVQGRFCIKCGSPVAAPAAPATPTPEAVSPDAPTRLAMRTPVMPPQPAAPAAPAAPPAYSAPAAAAAAAPAKKKTSPLVWILVGILVFFLLIGVAVVGAGFFFVHKARQAGFDPDLMKNNPGLAVTKMLAAANPDIDVVRVDERKGLITLREKSTGKTTTVDFQAVKEGRISFRDDKGESVTLSGGGDSMEMKSSSGESVKIGAGADVKVPSWIPAYPGAKVEGKYTRQGADGEAGAYGFKTNDPVKNVLAFYSNGFKSAGLNITSQLTQDAGDSPGGMISAEDGSKSKTVVVTVGTESGSTSVAVTYGVKK